MKREILPVHDRVGTCADQGVIGQGFKTWHKPLVWVVKLTVSLLLRPAAFIIIMNES